VLSADVTTAYGLGDGDWRYEIEAVDDEELPTAGALLTAIEGAPVPWTGWDPQKSYGMVGALRAADLHRIGRVWVGLPHVARVRFTTGPPLVVKQTLSGPAGTDPSVTVRHHCDTQVTLS
jgi:hypothetical protein